MIKLEEMPAVVFKRTPEGVAITVKYSTFLVPDWAITPFMNALASAAEQEGIDDDL